MSRRWERIEEQTDGEYNAEELERIAYRLVTEQVLYRSDRLQRTAYTTVQRFYRDYKDALDEVGIDLKHSVHLGYVCAIPRHGAHSPISMQETLFAVVLRKAYDDAMRKGEVTEGEVFISLDEFAELFRASTGRQMPVRGELRSVVDSMIRFGLVREVEDETHIQPFDLVIRPAIVDVLGEAALRRLMGETAAAVTEDPAAAEAEPDDE